MNFINLSIPDVILVEPFIFNDDRGYFLETYHRDKFLSAGIACNFVQDNYAKSIKNTLRGLHYQEKYPQDKLVRCLKGKVFDVAVDIRKKSPYFGQWVGQELSEENKYQLFIPKGFAHGYYVMSEIAEVSYKCSDIYHPEDENGILWNDSEIGITWPTLDPILSDKDANNHKLMVRK